MTAEYGQWTVDVLDTDEGARVVNIEFSHMTNDGVEQFSTNMPPEHARDLAEALVLKAEEVGS